MLCKSNEENINFIYEDFKENPNLKPATSMEPPVIDKSKVCFGLFDGASQGNLLPCGAGGVLFISDDLSYSFRIRTGRGTNIFAELQVILNLLKRASVKA
jgi:hypothetical protein